VEVKKTNRKILVVPIVLMAAAFLIAPTMAIGPFKALDVGKNKNLEARGPAVVNHRGGEGGGVIFWLMGSSGEHWVRWEFQDAASQAKGLMNNAVIAEYSGPVLPLPARVAALVAYINSLADEYENKWIYLSGDGATYPGQYIGHGMLWWFMYSITFVATPGTVSERDAAATVVADEHVEEHPEGSFWKTNEIKGSLP
jgi:hypothetical protein